MDHTYVLRDEIESNIKIETENEIEYPVEIKIEEISVEKSNYFEYPGMVYSPISFEMHDIKVEESEEEINKNTIENQLNINDPLNVRVNFHDESLESELERCREELTNLKEHNFKLSSENKLLRTKLLQKVKKPRINASHYHGLKDNITRLTDEINALKTKNQSYLAELLELKSLKDNHLAIEKQVIDLRSKIFDFANIVLPLVEENYAKEIEQLKNIISIKNKQIQHLNTRIDYLTVSLQVLKNKIAVVSDFNKNNYLKQVIRTDNLKNNYETARQSKNKFKMKLVQIWKKHVNVGRKLRALKMAHKQLYSICKKENKIQRYKRFKNLKVSLRTARKMVYLKQIENQHLIKQIKFLKLKQESLCL